MIWDWRFGRLPAYRVESNKFMVIFRDDPDYDTTIVRDIIVVTKKWSCKNYFRLMIAVLEAIEKGARLVDVEKQDSYELSFKWVTMPALYDHKFFGSKNATVDQDSSQE
jgi:hypothetical protein